MHRAAMICMCEHEACSQIYTSQNIRLPRIPAHIHTCSSVWTCRPYDVHRHLLCPFPDARWRYQNVEPKCVWAVVSNSIWGERQIFVPPIQCVAYWLRLLFLAHRIRAGEICWDTPAMPCLLQILCWLSSPLQALPKIPPPFFSKTTSYVYLLHN